MPQTPSSKYLYYQIKPFKDNELWVGHWEKLIKNLVSLKSKKITFLICGNRDDIQLFVRLPKDFQAYFQNTFYTTFTTSDLVKSDRICLAGERVYLDQRILFLVIESFWSAKNQGGIHKWRFLSWSDDRYFRGFPKCR